MSYAEGKAIIWHAYNRLGMTQLVDKSVFLFLIHMCREKIFSDFSNPSFRNDYVYKLIENKVWYGDIENHSILREVTQAFNDELSYFDKDSNTFYDIVCSLMEISSEWYYDYYTKIFNELLLLIFSKYQSNEFFQPAEITYVISKLSGYKNNDVVYNPFAGLASYGVELNVTNGYFAQEKDKKTWAIGVLHLLANNINADNYVCQDSVLNWEAKYHYNDSVKPLFDVIVATPPFGMPVQHEEFWIEPLRRKCSIEEFFIVRGLEGLKVKGKLIGNFSAGVLFNGSNDSLRKFSIDNDYLEMIVSLPANLNFNTSMSSVILLFNKNKVNRGVVKIVDGTSFFKKKGRFNILDVEPFLSSIDGDNSQLVKTVTNQEIIENDYILSVGRYFSEKFSEIEVPQGFSLVKLGNLITQKRGVRTENPTGKIVKIGDLSSDAFNYEKIPSDIETSSSTSISQKINSNVLLLSKIRNLKPTYFLASEKEPIFCNNNIVAFDVDCTKVDISYLILELNSDRVTKYVNSRFAGVTIPSIQIKDLMEIPILLPNLEAQQKSIVEAAFKEFQEGRIVELGFKIDELKDARRDAYEKNMRLRKHALTQVLNKFTPEFALLKACKDKNAGMLSDDMIVASRTGETVAVCFQQLELLANKLEILVDRLVDEQIYGEPQDIWIEQFLENYSNNHHAISFPVRFKHKPYIADKEIAFGSEVIANVGEVIFSYQVGFAKKDLIQVLDNIIVNAEKYGFIDPSRTDYEVEISLEEVENKIVIKVANNGAPLHNSTSAEKLFTWGGGDGTGLGLWQVKNIVEHFNGEVSIIDNKEDEYPVVFRIALPLTNRF